MKTSSITLIIVASGLGMLLGAALTFLLSREPIMENKSKSEENAPLYWVAPMDANYRRDKPGKSPMGMDLIPVYEEQQKDTDEGPGTITISPDVVNNLGVRTGIVTRRPLNDEIVTVGYVRYDENQLVHVHPRVSGWVEKLYVTAAGDPVKKGEPLYSLYAPELVNAQEELVLAVNRGNDRFVRASENRLKALHISEAFISELKRTLKIKQTVNFYSPQSGVIDNLKIREGFFVEPNTTIMSIGALDHVWVEAEIFERQASVVKAGMPVTMTLDYAPGRKWEGEVEYIHPTLDSETRTVRARLGFDNPDRTLKPNMFAQVRIEAGEQTPTLVVPREAVIRTGSDDRVVLALGEGSYKSVNVSLGRSDKDDIEILEGLEEGEKVVTSAQFLLDSESSKTSDFKRLHHGEEEMPADPVQSADVTGTINSIDSATRILNISRGPIEKWQRPAATLDFIAATSIDLSKLKLEQTITFTFEIRDGEFVVTHLQPVSNSQSSEQLNHTDMQMDHSNHAEHQQTDTQ